MILLKSGNMVPYLHVARRRVGASLLGQTGSLLGTAVGTADGICVGSAFAQHIVVDVDDGNGLAPPTAGESEIVIGDSTSDNDSISCEDNLRYEARVILWIGGNRGAKKSGHFEACRYVRHGHSYSNWRRQIRSSR